MWIGSLKRVSFSLYFSRLSGENIGPLLGEDEDRPEVPLVQIADEEGPLQEAEEEKGDVRARPKTWSEDFEEWKGRVLDAVASIQGGMSIRKAAKAYCVAAPTIVKCMKKGDVDVPALGGRPWLTADIEKDLVDWCVLMTKVGCQLQIRKMLPTIVQHILNKKKKKLFPNGNLPTDGWVRNFFRRHTELSNPIPKQPLYLKGYVTPEVVDKFFTSLEDYLTSEGLTAEEFLTSENASRIFSCDDRSISLSADKGMSKVSAKKGTRTPRIESGEAELMRTVLWCVSASGKFMKPLILNKGKTPTAYEMRPGLDMKSFNVGCSESGCMTGEIFYTWISDFFHGELRDSNIARPVLLLLDGPSSHLNLDTLYFARDNGILLFCLPPHSSDIMQPLDVVVFKPLEDACHDAYRECWEYISETDMPEKYFPYVFMKALQASSLSGNAISGFQATGLVPYNPTAIKRDKLAKITEEILHKTTDGREDVYKEGYIHGQMNMRRRLEALLPHDILEVYQKRVQEGQTQGFQDLNYMMWLEARTIVQCPPGENPYCEINSQPPSPSAETTTAATPGGIETKSDFVRKQIPQANPFKEKAPEISSTEDCQKYLEKKEKKRKLNQKEIERKKVRVAEKLAREGSVKGKGRNRKNSRLEDRESDVSGVDKLASDAENSGDDGDDNEGDQFSTCGKCDGGSGANRVWIGCQMCPRWYHKKCVGVSLKLKNEVLETIDWRCEFCL